MKRFAALFDALDRTTSTNAKVDALAGYLATAPAADAAWALYFLTGRRLKRLLPTRLLHRWTVAATGLPEWLIEESYSAVGDFAEAIDLLLDGRVSPVDEAALRAALDAGPVPARRPQAGRLPFDEPPATSPVIGIAAPAADALDTGSDDTSLADWLERRILPLQSAADDERRVRVVFWWSRLPSRERFLLNKMLTGEFRVGVSHTLVVRALARVAGLEAPAMAHRLMGRWEPSAAAFATLIRPGPDAEGPQGVDAGTGSTDRSRPYPFCLASPLEDAIASLGSRDEWLAEWKWDGIRAQLVRRAGEVFLWSRGDELITDRFPEIVAAAAALPDGVVLDGEILAFGDGAPRPFADLQHRLGRLRRVREVAAGVPVVFLAYDILEEQGSDVRALPLRERRARLLQLPPLHDRPAVKGHAGDRPLRLSEELRDTTWPALAARRDESRARQVEGLMLKRWSSSYGTGRRRGDWWKWKIEPYTVDAVLIYAQPGSGRRASLFTDYTFGVWDGEELVPIAKAYSGLSDEEIDELDRWIRRHTIERFGPVSAVEPAHVFELGFERIAASPRHRSGVAVRFPRMRRWRRDKTARDADTLETLRRLMPTPPATTILPPAERP